jgi:MFS family permease
VSRTVHRLRERSTALGDRGYRTLWLAHTGSTVGDGLYAVALVWLLVTTLDGGPVALTLLGLAQTVPLLALGIMGGVFADRLDQRRLMIAADLARAGAVGGLAIVMLLDRGSVGSVLVCAVLLATAGLLFGPARQSLLAAVVSPERMVSANALLSFSTQSSSLLAPAAAGALFGLIRPEGLLIIDAISFLWSAALLSQLRLGRPAQSRRRRSLMTETREGLRFIRVQPRIRALVAIGSLNQLLAAGPFAIAVPLWMANRLDGGVIAYGLVMSALAAGILCGSLLVGVIGVRRRLGELVATAVGADGLFFALAALAPSVPVSALCFCALGFSFALLGASLNAELQRTIPRPLLGRTFATFAVLTNIASPVSLTVTGVLLERFDAGALIIGAGLSLIGVGLVGLALLHGDAVVEEHVASVASVSSTP